MRRSATGPVACVLVLLATSALHARATKVAPELRAASQRGATSTVFIKLRPPLLPRGAAISTRRDRVAAAQRRVLAAPGIEAVRRLESVAALTANVTPEGLAALEAHPDVVRVDPLATGHGALAENLPVIRADLVHRRGLRGDGVTVAVLDTGIEVTHPDVAGRVVAQACFCSPSCCPNRQATQIGPGSAATRAFHGIHVAGIVASAGIVSAPGTAPGVRIVTVKVLDEENRGFLNDWIAGLDWILMNRPDVQAVNMSLASDVIYAGLCDQPANPGDLNSFILGFAEAIALLRERGVAVFAAAGSAARNADGANDRIALPACVDAAIAVGAVDRSGRLWRHGHLSRAIDLVAPGVSIVSDGPGGGLSVSTGTSMSTAFATGSAALLLAMNPRLSVSDLESVLKETGVPVAHRQGTRNFARIDDLAAVNRVWKETQPLLGGGSRTSDCLVSWDFEAGVGSRPRPAAAVSCRDGDPACDRDPEPARCGIDVRICFNRADGRLPACPATAVITSYALGKPSASGDAVDVANRNAILQALPPVPAVGEVCSESVRLAVPLGSRLLRLVANAEDGRRDDDRVRASCLPASK